MINTTHIPANETLRQLGGANRLAVMIQAKNFYHADGGRRLGFRIAGGLHVDVTLDVSDTYTIKVQKVRGMKVSPVAEREGVYADALISSLEAATGLAWHL